MRKPQAATDILELPYDLRRFICLDENAKKLTRTSPYGHSKTYHNVYGGLAGLATWWATATATQAVIGTAAGMIALGPVVGFAVGVGILGSAYGMFHVIRSEYDDATAILRINRSSISKLVLPLGHPRQNVIYVAHPGISNKYIPIADFHKTLFAEKYAEVVRLLRSLGAKEIAIKYVSGWSKQWAASAGIDIQSVDDSKGKTEGNIAYNEQSEMHIIGMFDFADSSEAPSVPSNLVWYMDEPNWKEIASGRLERKLSAFRLKFGYTNDFGVNGKLGAKFKGAGLDLGGEFSEFEATTWEMVGKFYV
jgi:hypothetical protein